MNKYLIATREGGLMECPQITYRNYQVVEAPSRKEALESYNSTNNCTYFHGTTMAEKVDSNVTVVNEAVSVGKLQMLL